MCLHQGDALAIAKSVAAVTTFFCLFANKARADFFTRDWETHHENPHEFDLGLDTQYYYTNSNFNDSGGSLTPSGLNYADRIDFLAYGNFGVTDKLTIYAVFDWRRAESESNSTLVSGDTYGLGDQTLGANYRIHSDSAGNGFSIDLQLQLDFAGYSNGSSGSGPPLGDGSEDLSAGLFANLPLAQWSNHDIEIRGGAGVTYRSSGFSASLPWSAYLDYQPKATDRSNPGLGGFVASIGGYGIVSVQNGGSTNTVAYGSAGSFVTNSIDPTLVSARGSLGYRFDNGFEVTAGGAQSLFGVNAPDGFTAFLGASFHLWPPKPAKNPAAQTPFDYRKSNSGFVSYGLEAKVLRSNDQFNLIKIDRGSDDEVRVGDIFDVFSVHPDGSDGEAIARCQVTHLKPSEAALRVDEYYREVSIREGFIARRLIR